MSEALILIAKVILVCVGAISLVAIYVYLIKAARRTKSGINAWGTKLGWNPGNLIFFPSYLTDAGLAYREKCIQATLVFFSCVLMLITIMVFENPEPSCADSCRTNPDPVGQLR